MSTLDEALLVSTSECIQYRLEKIKNSNISVFDKLIYMVH